MNKNIAIGVDVGGSHISCAAFDLDKKKYLEHTFAENDLDNHAEADVITDIWFRTINESIAVAGTEKVAGIGFAMPGPFDYENGIPYFKGENGKYENIYGINVPELLREFLNVPENFPVRFINDATAFALGEDRVGKAGKFKRSLSVTLGTGFGSAFIKDSLPIVEGDEVPHQGCVWHLPFDGGIADDYFSTRGFLKRYFDKTGDHLPGVKELAVLAGSDNVAKSLFDDFGLKMGIFLEPWIKKFGIEVFVIGGNISKAYPLFEKSLTGYLSEKNISMEIAISELKETASIIGSASLVDENLYEDVKPLLSLMS